MKQLLLFFSLILLAISSQAQVIYVDGDADGDNNGTSWMHAYSDLGTAIDSAEAGDALWIAAGRYVIPSDSTPFFIDRELSLYGGFAGDEASAEQADPDSNETILSGDVLNNDMDGSYDSLLAVDNNRVLIIIDTNETSQFTVTLDGLTIRDGAIAADYSGGSIIPFSGAGIYAQARTSISRVKFMANRAPVGAATAHIFSTSSKSTFTDVESVDNYLGLAGSHYSNSVDSITFHNSVFRGNQDTVDAALIEFTFGDGLVVDSCVFSDNLAAGSFGSAISTFQGLNHKVMNSSFRDLTANTGGAISFSNRDLLRGDRPVNAAECIVDNCTFNDITGIGFGGTIFFNNISHTISNSTFTDGLGALSEGLGGAVYAQSQDTLNYNYRVESSTFERNISGSEGGAIFYYSDNIDVDIIDCNFTNNLAEVDGGAMFIRGTADGFTETNVTNCTFTGNTSSGFAAAALFLFEDATISGCKFTDNSATNGSLYVGGVDNNFRVVNTEFSNNGDGTPESFARGAGIWGGLSAGDSPDTLIVDGCLFEENQVSGDEFISGGSAMYIDGGAGESPLVQVLNSSFISNGASDGDGTIYTLGSVELEILHSDFDSNSATNGGAISVLRTTVRDTIDNVPLVFYEDDNEPKVTVDGSLFLLNQAGSQGGAINMASASITMKNSILIKNSLGTEGGSGGALIINGSVVPGTELDNYLINNTFLSNKDGGNLVTETTPESAGNAVALFQPGNTDPDTNSLVLTLQNNAFFVVFPGLDEEEEEYIGIELTLDREVDPVGFGAVSVNSLGGNYFGTRLSADENITFNQVSGTDEENPTIDITTVFVDPEEDDFDSEFPDVNLLDTDDNPLVDGGTTGDLVPELDFFGLERDDMPDIGAIELGATSPVSVAEPVQDSGLALDFFPNPTIDVVNIRNEDPSIQRFTVLVSDVQGRYLAGKTFSGQNNQLNVSTLPSGVYNLTLLINGKSYSKQILKQ